MTHGRGSWHTPIDVTHCIERRGDRDRRVRARLQVLKWPPGSDWSTEDESGRSVPYVVIPAGNVPERKGALFGHIAPRLEGMIRRVRNVLAPTLLTDGLRRAHFGRHRPNRSDRGSRRDASPGPA